MTVQPPWPSNETILLPPSKGKAEGGDGPPYGISDALTGPLASPRTKLMDAAHTEVTNLDDAAVKRICGVRSVEIEWARELMAALPQAPTMPARNRYTGVVYNNARLPDRDLPANGTAVRIISPLMGLVGPDEPVPEYRLEFSARLPHHGALAAFWRKQAAGELAAALDAGTLWDLLPGEHARIWASGAREHRNYRGFVFIRSNGKAANAARTKLLKGRIAGWLLDRPGAEPKDLIAGLELPDGWATVRTDGTTTIFVEA